MSKRLWCSKCPKRKYLEKLNINVFLSVFENDLSFYYLCLQKEEWAKFQNALVGLVEVAVSILIMSLLGSCLDSASFVKWRVDYCVNKCVCVCKCEPKCQCTIRPGRWVGVQAQSGHTYCCQLTHLFCLPSGSGTVYFLVLVYWKIMFEIKSVSLFLCQRATLNLVLHSSPDRQSDKFLWKVHIDYFWWWKIQIYKLQEVFSFMFVSSWQETKKTCQQEIVLDRRNLRSISDRSRPLYNLNNVSALIRASFQWQPAHALLLHWSVILSSFALKSALCLSVTSHLCEAGCLLCGKREGHPRETCFSFHIHRHECFLTHPLWEHAVYWIW